MEALLDGLIMGTVISGLSPRTDRDRETAETETETESHREGEAFGEADAAPAELVNKHLLGQCLLDGGDANGAVEEWETCLAEARLLKLNNAEGAISANLGVAYHTLGDWGLSIQRLTRAVAMARRRCDRAAEGRRLCNLGSAYMCYGQQLLRTAAETSGRQLGASHYQHQLDKAMRLFAGALDISRELGDRTAEARRLGNLGIACRCAAAAAPTDERRRTLARLAIQHDTDAVTICRVIGDRRSEGRRLGNLGTVYDMLGQKAEAVYHHGAALSIARALGDRRREGRILLHLGNVCYNHPDAELHASPSAIEHDQLEHYRQALKIFKEVGDEIGMRILRRVIQEGGEESEPEPNSEDEALQELARTREDLRCHQVKMERDAAELARLRQRRAEIRMSDRLARDSGEQAPALVKEADDEERQQQDATSQHQQALDIARWVMTAAEQGAQTVANARPRLANLYAAQASMERMDDLIEAAEAAARGQLIVGED